MSVHLYIITILDRKIFLRQNKQNNMCTMYLKFILTRKTSSRCSSGYYVPHRRGGGHIVFGADPVGVGVGMTLSCLQDIL